MGTDFSRTRSLSKFVVDASKVVNYPKINPNAKTIKNVVIVLFGVIGMIVGTYVSIDQLVTDLSGNGTDTCKPANLTMTWYPPKIVQ